MDTAKYNFYYSPGYSPLVTGTYRVVKEKRKTDFWCLHTKTWQKVDILTKIKKQTYNITKINPILFSCPDCNNNGCDLCKDHYFSIWNKFNGHN